MHDITGDPAALARNLANTHPAIDVRILPRGGHWIAYEQAEAVNALLRAWLTGMPAPAT